MSKEDKHYWLHEILKWAGLLFLPTLTILTNQAGPYWGLLPYGHYRDSIYVLGILIAGCIGASQTKAALSKWPTRT